MSTDNRKPAPAPARELAAELLDYEAQFGPVSEADTACMEISPEDWVRWVQLAKRVQEARQ